MSKISVLGVVSKKKTMDAHDCTATGSTSLASICVDLLSLPSRKQNAKCSTKHAKEQQESKYSRQYHHVENKHDVCHYRLKMDYDKSKFPVLPHAGPHKPPRGARGLMTHYHVRCDRMIGQDRCAVRCIPCTCKSCTDQRDLPWKSHQINQDMHSPKIVS